LNFKERMFAVLYGEEPDQIPFGIHADLFPRGLFERELRNMGVGLVEIGIGARLESAIWSEMPNVTVKTQTKGDIVTTIYETPVGSVSTKRLMHVPRMDMPPLEWMFKSEADYDVLIYMIEDTVYHRSDKNYYDVVRDLGDDGIVIESGAGISPPYESAFEYMGLKKWATEQYKNPHEFNKLLRALERRVERALPLAAEGPAKIVYCGSISGYYGPKQFKEYVLPFYKKYLPFLHSRGKICIVHAHSSRLKCIKDFIPKTGLDVIEAFTPPPVGDLSLEEAIDAWSDRIAIWVNLPESVFSLGVEETKKYVLSILKNAQLCPFAFVSTEIALLGIKDEITKHIMRKGFRAAAEIINKYGKYTLGNLRI